MAAEFLASHGVNLQQELTRVQFGRDDVPGPVSKTSKPPLRHIRCARLPNGGANEFFDISLSDDKIEAIVPHNFSAPRLQHPQILDAQGQLLAPSLCHPHIHLDKCFLLGDSKYSDLEILRGDFPEAMQLTTQAKARFETDDLIRRGRRLIRESLSAGVTVMRAFVEVDAGVGTKCVDAGLMLKKEFQGRCDVQISVFAQLPIFSSPDGGLEMRRLIQEAARRPDVESFGTAPYVETDTGKMKQNIEWAVELCLREGLHLDFHLDYNLDAAQEPMVWHVLDTLQKQDWRGRAHTGKTIVLSHCTRLTLFNRDEWTRLRESIRDLPISFVGLPTSDLFMMGRPEEEDDGCGPRVRGTLPVPNMIKSHGFQGAIGVNNVGNAFTPQGNCDPLSIASLGVGVYQTGTKNDTQLLYECVSSRAKAAIGCGESSQGLGEGSVADLILFGRKDGPPEEYKQRKIVQELVYSPPLDRLVVKGGVILDI
ncbi:cytosine deaminase protein-like protein [Xylona heveae TC161]|uniref:Cytosine deaminase protein-like protein n=1 Tax=Xylona heveae (strain CBS 132557 / TC161) TaxID=1328760 RepID=A0A165IR17_XYLHT|nr:cytosine deaminase protein-like protein [Xylona heveae TC161]KZF25260.1 cytosine deaminase protein-like protein [Xylona heveae TC161]